MRKACSSASLTFDDINVEIRSAGVLPDNHTFVNFRAGADEDLAARSCRLKIALPVVYPARSATSEPVRRRWESRPAIRCSRGRESSADRGAACIGENFTAQADQAARRNFELEAHTA